MENSQTIGSVIAKLIKKAGYTQGEFSRLILVRENYLNRALKKDPVPVSLMQKVAAAFDITISALIDPKTSVSYRSARSLEGLSMVNEVQVPYLSPGENLAALRDENRRLKEQIAEMAKELEKRGEMNSDLLEILKSLAKGEK